MTVGKKIVVANVVTIVLFGCAVLLGLYSGMVLFGAYNSLRNEEYAELRAVLDLRAAVEAQDSAVGMLLAYPSERQAFTDELRAAESEVELSLAELRRLEAQHGASLSGVSVDDIAAAAARYEEVTGRVVSAVVGDDGTQAAALFAHEGRSAAEELTTSVSRYLEGEETASVAAGDAMGRRMWTFAAFMISLSVVALVVGVALAVTIPRSISRQLKGAVSSLSSSAAEMMAIAAQVAAGAAQTAASTSETTATVEEVKQTALLSTEKAGQVSDRAQEMSQIAEQGRQAVEDMIDGIGHMQDRWERMVDTVARLSDQTQTVGEIIATVSDLAEQSNLLSVNASIEAAKAGEQGKGFTVVAQEVKSLAEQSKQAVSQVRTILSEVQKASAAAVAAAEKGVKAMELARRQSLESGEAIQLLAESVAEAAQSAVQIAASSRQQLAGMEQISQAIASINQAGGQTVAGAWQNEQIVGELQRVTHGLRSLVGADTGHSPVTA